MYLKEIGLSPRKALWHCKYNMYIISIAKLIDQGKYVNLFALFYLLDLVVRLNLVSDNIILIFSQSNVNILTDTKIKKKQRFKKTARSLTLKAPRKNASENVVCCKLLPKVTDELNIEANGVDPEQTAPKEQSDLGPHCLPKRLFKHFSRREKQTTFVAIGSLRVQEIFLSCA